MGKKLACAPWLSALVSHILGFMSGAQELQRHEQAQCITRHACDVTGEGPERTGGA